MLRQALHEIRVPTRGRGLYEFTGKVADWVSQNGFTSGLVTLHLRHTSASLLIQENADPDVRRDLESFFARLVPDGDPLFVHTAEGDDDMPAHVRTALTAVNLSIPVSRASWRWAPGRESTSGNTAAPRTPARHGPFHRRVGRRPQCPFQPPSAVAFSATLEDYHLVPMQGLAAR